MEDIRRALVLCLVLITGTAIERAHSVVLLLRLSLPLYYEVRTYNFSECRQFFPANVSLSMYLYIGINSSLFTLINVSLPVMPPTIFLTSLHSNIMLHCLCYFLHVPFFSIITMKLYHI